MHKEYPAIYMPRRLRRVVSLGMILMQLHHRYELGFIPPASDGKRHELSVELTKAATGEHKGGRLRSPRDIPVREETEGAQ